MIRQFSYRGVVIIAVLLMASSLFAVPSDADSLKAAMLQLELRVRQLESELMRLSDATAQTGNTESVLDADNMIAGRSSWTYLPPRAERPLASESPAPEQSLTAELEVSGFMDGVYDAALDRQSESNAALNQVEIDIARDIGSQAEVGLSLCYDETIVVGAATIAFAPYLRESDEGQSAPSVSKWTLTAGQFSVPFGLDYVYYCSPDRPTITQPDVYAATHESWNEVGLTSSLGTRWGSLDVYAVKGFETRVWNSEDEINNDATDDDERWLYSQPQVSCGARLNLTLIPGVECGASFARGWQTNRTVEHTISGAHVQAGYRNFLLKAEGIRLLKAESVKPTMVEGWYLEGMQGFGRFFALARQDYVNDEESGIARHYSVGGGVRIDENLECRAEYRTDENGADRHLLTQVVAKF